MIGWAIYALLMGLCIWAAVRALPPPGGWRAWWHRRPKLWDHWDNAP